MREVDTMMRDVQLEMLSYKYNTIVGYSKAEFSAITFFHRFKWAVLVTLISTEYVGGWSAIVKSCTRDSWIPSGLLAER